MATVDFDYFVGRIRGVVIALSLTLSADESAEVEELLDHAELGEALRTLGWLIVEEGKQVPRAQIDEIAALAHRMGIARELPPSLEEHGIDDA